MQDYFHKPRLYIPPEPQQGEHLNTCARTARAAGASRLRPCHVCMVYHSATRVPGKQSSHGTQHHAYDIVREDRPSRGIGKSRCPTCGTLHT